VKAISEEALAKPPEVDEPTTMHLPKPHPLSRLLVILSVLMIAILASLLVFTAHHVNGLLSQIRINQELRQNPPLPPLPTDAALMDDNIFSVAVRHYPNDAMRLYCARAAALFHRGDAYAAIACYQEAHVLLDNDLPAAGRIELSRALMQTGQFESAKRELRTLNFETLNDNDLAMANDVLSRILLAQQLQQRQTIAHSAALQVK
jgi:tetratricopeptide (TPR) repeat protein